MPYPNVHSCRLKEPGQFERFVTLETGDHQRIIGYRKDGSSDVQAIRYPKDKWDAKRAAKHCARNGGRFEAALKGK